MLLHTDITRIIRVEGRSFEGEFVDVSFGHVELWKYDADLGTLLSMAEMH